MRYLCVATTYQPQLVEGADKLKEKRVKQVIMIRHQNSFIRDLCTDHNLPLPAIEIPSRQTFSRSADDVVVVSMLRAFGDKAGIDLAAMRYLEIGANHPIAESATYLAHVELGMTGVLVEADEGLIESLRQVRQGDTVVNAAITNTNEETIDLYVSENDQTSSVSREFIDETQKRIGGEIGTKKTAARRIDSILREHFSDTPPIFVYVNTQGLNFEFLTDFPFSYCRPYLLQFEASAQFSSGKTHSMTELLALHGYSIVAASSTSVIAVDLLAIGRKVSGEKHSGDKPQWAASSAVPQIVEAHTYLSVDIFDTLLFRHCKSPIDVFTFMASHSQVLEVTEFFSDFRTAAEKQAREDAKERQAEDVSFQEIYDCFRQLTNCTRQQAEAIQAIELQTEQDLLYPTNFGQRLINHARQAKKRVVITSDMYLPQEFLETLLIANGITGWERVFVSNVQGKTKHSGNLFQDVIDHFDVPADQILHIGDNRRADGDMAIAAGLKTHLVLASKDIVARSRRTLAKGSHMLRGTRPVSQIFIANYLETHHCETAKLDFRELSDDQYFESVGSVLLAPIIVSFMVWMKKHMDKRGIDRAVFLARDGMFPKKAFDLLWPTGHETHYIAASRRLLALPFAVEDPDRVKWMFQTTLNGCETLEEFNSKIAAGPKLISLFTDNDWNLETWLTQKHRAQILDMLKDNSQTLYDSFEDERETLIKYYKSMFPENSKSVVFDVGWRGSLQRSICEMTEGKADITGLYFGTSLFAYQLLQKNELDYESYTVHNGLAKIKLPWDNDFRDLVEFLLSADHGSVLQIKEREDGAFLWQTAEVPELERTSHEIAAKIQNAALAAIASVL
ncbi:MAG: HAD-IA family hydrolase, partial [Lentilitoribacter sp.]